MEDSDKAQPAVTGGKYEESSDGQQSEPGKLAV